jgi:hypothetical protein
MYTIQANASGTRTIEVTESNLQTIKKYSLFMQIADSTGNIRVETLDKLRFTVRSLIASCEEDSKALLELCLVLYDDNMKPLGLGNLIECYNKWEEEQAAPTTENTENE